MEQKAHKTYMDCIRIIASFGVIYNHVFGYALFDTPGVGGIAAQFAFFSCKIAVPLFFMITGALLLPREDTYRKTYGKILRIGVILVAMCVFYTAVNCLTTGAAFDMRALLLAIYRYEPPDTNAYWFLYRYLSLLVMLPVLQRILPAVSKRDLVYYLILTAVFAGVIPVTQHLWGQPPLNLALQLYTFSAYIAMLFLGLYIDRHMVPSKRGNVLAAGGIVLCTAALVALTRLDPNPHVSGNLYFDNCAHLPIVAAAACAFYLCKSLFAGATLSERARAAWTRFGRLTFCIYLFGDLFINLLEPTMDWLTKNFTQYGGRLLYTAAAYGLSMLLAAVLTRVPGLKKLL